MNPWLQAGLAGAAAGAGAALLGSRSWATWAGTAAGLSLVGSAWGAAAPSFIVHRASDDPKLVVAYVHGYSDTVSSTWRRHHLKSQFVASGLDATFIAAEAPSKKADAVRWPDLSKLLEAAKIELGARPLIVAGHSGAYRTISSWLGHPAVKNIVLLDALYSRVKEFTAWFRRGGRVLTELHTWQTRTNAEALAKAIKATTRKGAPSSYDGFTSEERGAKALSIDSSLEHMQLVREGKVLPVLLQRAAGLP